MVHGQVMCPIATPLKPVKLCGIVTPLKGFISWQLINYILITIQEMMTA